MRGLGDQLAKLQQQLGEEDLGVNPEETKEKSLWDSVAQRNLTSSPLQQLIHLPCEQVSERQTMLKTVQSVEHNHFEALYKALNQRTQTLADKVLVATFPWRMRVGGIRGFQDLIIPAFHPGYGVPYIPASSIKGVVKAWAKHAHPEEIADVDRVLGFLDGDDSAIAAVQFLDSFPTKPCLSVDIATAQWQWDNSDRVSYKADPHPMLSLQDVTLNIGLTRTVKGTMGDVEKVYEWLGQALLAEGLGGRISAGYGRVQKVKGIKRDASLRKRYVSSRHSFEFWSEGMHGALPPNVEFRPTAIRSLLRYWFRAVSLGLYVPAVCKQLENDFFGSLDPEQPGEHKPRSLRIIVNLDSNKNNYMTPPYIAEGALKLEAIDENSLKLAQCLLKLAFHLGAAGKGARRPLHYNSGRLRGGYLQLLDEKDLLNCAKEDWQSLLLEIKKTFIAIRPVGTPPIAPVSVGLPVKQRYQDVLNQQAHIYLVPTPGLKHPNQLKIQDGRRNNGGYRSFRGGALDFFYGSGYKGVNRDGDGNEYTGGRIQPSIPSFVWIASNALHLSENAYQVITIFGVAQDSEREDFQARRSFVTALKRKFPNAIQVR